ncbi:MAG TPA: methionine adenosyltransferase domain-containing protein [Bacilli bacterium]|nr:methionine adenosyltransferase domain-containing protein [Bacilli bacterium]
MLKTAESVSPMHPDKICDRISDAILDACLKQDPDSRCAIETMGGHNIITVTGEMTTNAFVDIPEIVKGIVGDKYGVQTNIVKQSPDIARGVDVGGAGDQGIMVGYACRDNAEMIPNELFLARQLCKYIYGIRQEDGKTQITLEDDKISKVVASFCNVSHEDLQLMVDDWLLGSTFETSEDIQVFINPAGDWTQGGFDADTGLTGRKLIVDNYGPQIPIGGGAFSGKDASKVDRSGAYVARKMAVDILKSDEKCNEVIVKLAYAIGRPEPVMATVQKDGGEIMEISFDQDGAEHIKPKNIIEDLQLKRPIFEKTAEWGAFGNGFDWDK